MAIESFETFGVGCIGAAAPEIVRLYNLRLKPEFRWSWGYLLFSIPFILLGGFVSCLLEPTSKYAAFYAGISTPILISSIARNAGVTTSKTPSTVSQTASSRGVLKKPQRESKGGDANCTILPAPKAPLTSARKPSLLKQFLNAL
jgi:hypothetical protein